MISPLLLVENAKDLNVGISDSIDDVVGQSGNHQLPRPRLKSKAAHARKGRQVRHAFPNPSTDFARRDRIVLPNEPADGIE